MAGVDPLVERDGACPAVVVGGPVPHRWVALAVHPDHFRATFDGGTELVVDGTGGQLTVLEVCPACRQWQFREYARAAHGIVPRDDEGVHSPS